MKTIYHLIILFVLIGFPGMAQVPGSFNCEFTVAPTACINQHVKVLYTGGASANATYTWNFDGAVIISGSGQGPYYVKWETTGEKHITLSIHFEGLSCTGTKPVHVIHQPAAFHMTGGGAVIPGTPGVLVGLSGSESGIIYKLRLNGQYTGATALGTGQVISFGPQLIPGNYTAVAKVDGSDCLREMEGVAVVTSLPPPPLQHICMVTFDTATSLNKIVWNKHPGLPVLHYNIFKETYQNNIFTKIGEVPYTSMSVFVDTTSDPLIKSDKFKISVTDSAGHEGEKSLYHKTIHLNINPGIFGFNLIWNHYEGFEFKTYKIHRKYASGPWELIDSIASNVDSYTDFYTAPGITTYYIEVIRLEPCNPSLKSNEIMSVISNTAYAAPLGQDENKVEDVLIYPNPATDKITISMPGNISARFELLTLDGRTLTNGMISAPRSEIKITDLAKGIYLLKITGDKMAVVRKIVKN